MGKIEKIDWEKFKILVRKLIEHKTRTSYVPIKAENWEEVLYIIFVHMFMKDRVDWDPLSHAKGVDLKVKLNGDVLSISAKGGKITPDKKLSVSSYRLTRFDTIEEKLEFLKENADDLDVYLICSREERTKINMLDYRVFKINSEDLAPSVFLDPLNWVENDNGWIFTKSDEVGFEARIVKKMSHQLWYSISLSNRKLEKLCDLSFSTKTMGQLLHRILD